MSVSMCPSCNQAMTLGDGSYWCMNKKCAEQFYPGGDEYLARVRLDTTPEVEIVYMPRSEWPESVREVFRKQLAKIPTPLLLSEVGRRNNAARKVKSGGRPKVLKPCPKCGALLGARERAKHHC